MRTHPAPKIDMFAMEDAVRTLQRMPTRLILAVLGITALCTSASVNAVPEKVHLVFSNHLVSPLAVSSALQIQLTL